MEIDKLDLPMIEKCVALSSLMLALDRVDNTVGHFAAYLKEWSVRSYNDLVLRVPRLHVFDGGNEVVRGDVFDIAEREVDLAYYDPPYGSNNEKMPPSRVRYGAYYHLWTTVCLNDYPDVFGRARRRVDTSDSVSGSLFEEFQRNAQSGRFVAVEAIERLIRKTGARWVILSYSSGGRATAEELDEILEKSGTVVETVQVEYRRHVMASMKWTNEWVRDAEGPNREFLFLIERG